MRTETRTLREGRLGRSALRMPKRESARRHKALRGKNFAVATPLEGNPMGERAVLPVKMKDFPELKSSTRS